MIEKFQKYNLKNHGVRLPDFEIEEKYLAQFPNAKNNQEFLRALCDEEMRKRNFVGKKPYEERLEKEYATLVDLGFTDYVLLIWRILKFCEEKNIPVGIGRGSAVGSFVLFLLSVTKVDPVKYGLYFERFISRARAKSKVVDGVIYFDGGLLPDVDTDVCYYRRGEVLTEIQRLFSGKTSKVLTINTLQGKLAIKEVLKTVLDFAESDANHISSLIERVFGQVIPLESVAEKNPQFKSWLEEEKDEYRLFSNADALKIALKIENLPKNFGIHPSAIAISHGKMQDTIPQQLTKDGERVTAYDMYVVQDLVVKVDILGLKNVSILDEVARMTGVRLEDVDLDDASIYDFLDDLRAPHGIFQIEAETAFRAARQIRPRDIYEISDLMAIARPGGLQELEGYVRVKNGEEKKEQVNPLWDKILEKTKGKILYQEQQMKLAHEIFGFSLEDAELLRRCVTGDSLLVSKKRGYISINRLMLEGYSDDLFLSMDENGTQTWVPIKDIWSNGIHQVRYVELRNGMEVKASRWHQFLTQDGWKARNYLEKDNDYIVCAKSLDFEGQDLVSRDFAVVCAGIITKGYFVDAYSSTFVNHDPFVMGLFIEAYEREFGKTYSLFKDGKVLSLHKATKEKIRKVLPQGKSASKFFPEVLLGLTKETMREMLSFAFACEGSFGRTNGISYTSKSKKSIQQIQLMLLRFGVRSYINVKNNKDYGDYYILLVKERKEVETFVNELSINLQQYKKDAIKHYLDSYEDEKRSSTTDVIPASLMNRFVKQYSHVLNYTSGRFFNSNVSRDKFSEFAEASKSKKWKKLASGKQEYSQIKNLEKDIREIEVFDFTVANEDFPFLVCNGMVIHNCIGKKKVDEIPLWKSKVEEKAKEMGVEAALANKFWDSINASANYSFNFSHSLSYATLAAYCIYFKKKFPLQFYLSLLKMSKHEPDPRLEIGKVACELADFDIKLLPPNFGKSDLDFKIEGRNIRFGLSSIKGIAEKAIENLRLLQSSGKSLTKFEFFLAAKSQKLSIGIVSALIQSGAIAFDDGKSRPHWVLEAQVFNVLTDKMKGHVLEHAPRFEHDLFKTLKGFVAEEIKDKSGKKAILTQEKYDALKEKCAGYLDIFRKNSKYERLANWFFEYKLLGYNYSSSLYGVLSDEFPNLKPLQAFTTFAERKQEYICGILEDDPKVSKSKKTASNMLKCEIRDGDGLTCIFFGDSFDKWLAKNGDSAIPQKGDIVIVRGSRSNDAFFLSDLKKMGEKAYLKLSELKDG